MTILSKGNAKLDRSCFIYSHTPVVGCGPWCKDCAKTCYAMNSYKQYKNVKAKWDANLALSKTNNFYAAFWKELKERKVKKVRLMQAGDFYNDSIINKFYYIIRDNPQVLVQRTIFKNFPALKCTEMFFTFMGFFQVLA